MGREYDVRTEGAELVVSGVSLPFEPWRFTPEGPDRWRGRTGENTGEILAVERAADGTVTGLNIATFVFSRDPFALA
jgi:hypothetical protein